MQNTLSNHAGHPRLLTRNVTQFFHDHFLTRILTSGLAALSSPPLIQGTRFYGKTYCQRFERP